MFDLNEAKEFDDRNRGRKPMDVPCSIWLIRVANGFVTIERRRDSISSNLDHWVINGHYESKVDASVRSDAKLHRVVVTLDFSPVRVE